MSEIDDDSSINSSPENHSAVQAPRVGVLLVNLGTPDQPTAPAVRRYLAEFLSDTRIVDLPRAIWLPILYGVILNIRPAATARNYQKIWRWQSNESPLRYHTRSQADALASQFGPELLIDWAMRYGNPSISERITAMKEAGCARLLVLPLYPQYSATTTASVHDAVFDAIRAMRWQPALRTAPAIHDEEFYINALGGVTRRYLGGLDWTPEKIILSFHGLPQRYVDAGDPYQHHCKITARLLREEMDWPLESAPLAYQSKFGREKWLAPSTENMIKRLAGEGVKKIAVITPGFVSDCIETLEEIDIVGRKTFLDASGEKFAAIPCLNGEPETIALLERFVRRETAGWIDYPA